MTFKNPFIYLFWELDTTKRQPLSDGYVIPSRVYELQTNDIEIEQEANGTGVLWFTKYDELLVNLILAKSWKLAGTLNELHNTSVTER